MLQNLTNELIDRFYEDVKSLGLKNPVTAIHEATGYNKGTVSMYLNRKDEPSKNFLDAFYNKFGESLKNANHKPQEAQHAPDLKDEIIALLKEKLNLNERLILQQLMRNQALLRAIAETLPQLLAKVDKIKLQEAHEEMNKRIERHLDVLKKESI